MTVLCKNVFIVDHIVNFYHSVSLKESELHVIPMCSWLFALCCESQLQVITCSTSVSRSPAGSFLLEFLTSLN